MYPWEVMIQELRAQQMSDLIEMSLQVEESVLLSEQARDMFRRCEKERKQDKQRWSRLSRGTVAERQITEAYQPRQKP